MPTAVSLCLIWYSINHDNLINLLKRINHKNKKSVLYTDKGLVVKRGKMVDDAGDSFSEKYYWFESKCDISLFDENLKCEIIYRPSPLSIQFQGFDLREILKNNVNRNEYNMYLSIESIYNYCHLRGLNQFPNFLNIIISVDENIEENIASLYGLLVSIFDASEIRYIGFIDVGKHVIHEQNYHLLARNPPITHILDKFLLKANYVTIGRKEIILGYYNDLKNNYPEFICELIDFKKSTVLKIESNSLDDIMIEKWHYKFPMNK